MRHRTRDALRSIELTAQESGASLALLLSRAGVMEGREMPGIGSGTQVSARAEQRFLRLPFIFGVLTAGVILVAGVLVRAHVDGALMLDETGYKVQPNLVLTPAQLPTNLAPASSPLLLGSRDIFARPNPSSS